MGEMNLAMKEIEEEANGFIVDTKVKHGVADQIVISRIHDSLTRTSDYSIASSVTPEEGVFMLEQAIGIMQNKEPIFLLKSIKLGEQHDD